MRWFFLKLVIVFYLVLSLNCPAVNWWLSWRQRAWWTLPVAECCGTICWQLSTSKCSKTHYSQVYIRFRSRPDVLIQLLPFFAAVVSKKYSHFVGMNCVSSCLKGEVYGCLSELPTFWPHPVRNPTFCTNLNSLCWTDEENRFSTKSMILNCKAISAKLRTKFLWLFW